MIVIIAGGREYYLGKQEIAWLNDLRAQYAIATICHGDSRGVDRAAAIWADSCGISVRPFPAEWKMFGRAAGPIRNAAMVQELVRLRAQHASPVAVLLFPGNRGTENLERQARQAQLPILKYPQSGERLQKIEEDAPCHIIQ